MGMFDNLYGADPRTQGLLAAGAAMMSGPSRMPVSLGQSIGQGYLAGNQAYQQAMQAEMQRKQMEEQTAYRQAQIQKMKDDAERKARMDDAIRGLLGGGPVPSGSVVAPPGAAPDAATGQPSSKTLQSVGTAMLISGDPRGAGINELARQRAIEEERAKEMQAMTATGTTKQNPTPAEAAVPVQPGAAERFMGPEAKVIPGLHQRAIALGNWIQRNPGGDPAYAKKELAAMDKMVEDYNAKMTADNSAYQREEENRRAAEERAAADRALRRQLAEAELARKTQADADRKAAEEAKAEERRIARQKPLPAGVVSLVTSARDNASTIDRLSSSFKEDFGGKGVLGAGAELQLEMSGRLGKDADAVEWWKNYRKGVELVERHALFGAALTPGEQASWRSADISPGMDPKVIKRNLETRAELSRKVFEATVADQKDAGHDADKIDALAGRASFAKPSGGAQTLPGADAIDAELARRKARKQLKGN